MNPKEYTAKLERDVKWLQDLAKAQEELLVCYRVGNRSRAGKFIGQIRKAKEALGWNE